MSDIDDGGRQELRLRSRAGRAELIDALQRAATKPWSRHQVLEDRAKRNYGWEDDEWAAFLWRFHAPSSTVTGSMSNLASPFSGQRVPQPKRVRMLSRHGA